MHGTHRGFKTYHCARGRERSLRAATRTESRNTQQTTLLLRTFLSKPSRDGFKEEDKLNGDPTVATTHLKQLTNKMAESKRLIKEYEKAAQADPAVDPAATTARKREMVSQLNAFVNKKKAAAAAVSERAEKAAEAEAMKAAKSAVETKNPLFGSPFKSTKKKDKGTGKAGLPSLPEPSAAGTSTGAGGADPSGVDLQMMEAGELVQFGRGKIKETDDAIERSKQTVANTIELGNQTAQALRGQTQQMERIVDGLDEIHFSMKKGMKLIKDLTRGLATDKCIMTLLFVVVCGVIAIIAVKIAGLDKDDEIADLGTSPSSEEAKTRRLLMSAAEVIPDAVERLATRLWTPP